MKPHTRLTPEQTKELLRLYTDTATPCREIAAQFGVDPTYPTVLARRNGVPMRSPATQNDMRRMRRKATP